MSKQNIPKLRFRDFDDEWEPIRITEIGNETFGGGTPKTSEDRYWNGNLHWIQSSDLLEHNIFISDTNRNITEEGVTNSAAKLIPKDSIAIVTRVGVGKLALVPFDYATSQDFLSISKLNFDKLFSTYLLYKIVQREKENVQGTSIKGIPKDVLLNKKAYITKNTTEQSAIGTLFQTLDELLSAYKDNLANYQALKASMLTKMFPKAGQTTPEIRLDGFDGEWEEKKLGDLAEIVRGASPRPIQDPKWFDDSSEVGWLRISDVTNQNGRIHYLEQRISELGQEKTRVLKEPHLLLSIAASVGKPVINYVKTGVHDGFLIFLNPTFDKEFMFQWLEMFKDGWNKYGQPGSQVNLNSDIVRNHKLSLPSLEEQQAIGSFFSNLDELISTYQEKIDQLETLKKKLLQEMFV